MSDSNNIDWRITEEERMLIGQWNRIMENCCIFIYLLHGKMAFEYDLTHPKHAAYEIMKAFHGNKWEVAWCKYKRELDKGGQQ